MPELNYRDLLLKYMRHVFDCERDTYVDRANDLFHGQVFTKEELEELKRIDGSINKHR